MSASVRSFVDVAIVGAGPCGLAAAIAAIRGGLSVAVFDRGCIVNGIASYPTYMTFFSTAERIAIGGVPFLVATDKPTRRDALAYYRGVASMYDVPVRQYETVESMRPVRLDPPAGEPVPTRAAQWLLRSVKRSGEVLETAAHAVIIATGYFGRPNLLQVPGESLPHVRHGYVEGHSAWREPVVIVGGGVIGLCTAYHALRKGFEVTLLERGPEGGDNCSVGNAGMIVPSHFTPLAAPGMISKGLRWMFNPESPFYVRPRVNLDLMRWGWLFYRHSTERHVAASPFWQCA